MEWYKQENVFFAFVWTACLTALLLLATIVPANNSVSDASRRADILRCYEINAARSAVEARLLCKGD